MFPVAASRASLRHMIIATFISLIAFGMMVPLLPLYVRQFGHAGLLAGLVMGLNQLVDFFVAPLVGKLSDHWGRRKLLLGAMLIVAASYLLVGQAKSVVALLVIWGLAGIGSSQILLTQAYITDVTSPEKRARGMGLWGASFALGFVIGPPLGTTLYARSPELAGIVSGVLALVAWMYALVRVGEPDIRRSNGTKPTIKASDLRVFRGKVLTSIVLYFVLVFVWSILTLLLAFYSNDEFGWNVRGYGMFLGSIGLVAAIVQGVLMGRLAKHVSPETLIKICFPLMGVGYLVLGFGSTEWWSLAAMVLTIATGFGVLTATLPTVLSLNASEGERGLALGVFQSFSTLARVIAPPVAGYFYDTFSHAFPFAFGGAVAILTGAFLFPRFRKA